MSIKNSSQPLFEAVQARQRALILIGAAATTIGILLGLFVGYEWFVRRVSHEVLALLAAVAVLFGVQLLVFTTVTGMLILLHQELLHRVEIAQEQLDD